MMRFDQAGCSSVTQVKGAFWGHLVWKDSRICDILGSIAKIKIKEINKETDNSFLSDICLSEILGWGCKVMCDRNVHRGVASVASLPVTDTEEQSLRLFSRKIS